MGDGHVVRVCRWGGREGRTQNFTERTLLSCWPVSSEMPSGTMVASWAQLCCWSWMNSHAQSPAQSLSSSLTALRPLGQCQPRGSLRGRGDTKRGRCEQEGRLGDLPRFPRGEGREGHRRTRKAGGREDGRTGERSGPGGNASAWAPGCQPPGDPCQASVLQNSN